MSLKVGIRIPPCEPLSALAAAARRAEDLGFDHVWFPDSQVLWRDVFGTLAAAALRTDRIGLGTAVTNLVTRHPTVVASAARTIAELAPGRFRLGVGVGNSSVQPVGLAPSTQAELRERLGTVRTLLAGEEAGFGTARSRLRDPGDGIPIHLAASGPRNLRLAGELADGVMLLSGVAPVTLASSLAAVREGAERAGRDPAALELTVAAHAHVTDDVERDARRLKPICAGIAQHGGRPFLALAGIEIEVPARVPQVYPDLVHAEDWDRAVAVCDAWVSDADAVRFAETFCLFGSAEHILGRLAQARAAGATAVFLQHVGSYDLPYELMEAIAGDVLPKLPA
ncbi:LLM class flavin-dependent oxidoreductase [Dactylosporangium sp. CA-092794]|uniref:LLM class flavin-dependent oxidoreductase n=1 Tax=Dactylosporangium sp. CA-092794 TaxID=3239929 RepID=UPI003D91538D